MSDRLAITGRKGDELEGLILDSRRLFHVIVQMLDGNAATDIDDDWCDSVLMLASMGRDVSDEANRAWQRERSR